MEKKNNKYMALLNVIKRELRRLVSRPLYLFCMVIAPLFCYIFFTTLMDSGLPTDMGTNQYKGSAYMYTTNSHLKGNKVDDYELTRLQSHTTTWGVNEEKF